MITRIFDSLVLLPLGSTRETFMYYTGWEKPNAQNQSKNLISNVVAGEAEITSAVARGVTLNLLVATTKKCENKTLHEQSAKKKYLTQGRLTHEKLFLKKYMISLYIISLFKNI